MFRRTNCYPEDFDSRKPTETPFARAWIGGALFAAALLAALIAGILLLYSHREIGIFPDEAVQKRPKIAVIK